MSRAVYVGDLPLDASSREIERAFAAHGVVERVEVKRPRHPPAFAFVTFDDARDAARAARVEDGAVIAGRRVRVERARGRAREARGDRDDDRDDDDDARDAYAGRMRSDRRGAVRRSTRDGATARTRDRRGASARRRERRRTR